MRICRIHVIPVVHNGSARVVAAARTVEIGSGWIVFDIYTKKRRAPDDILDRVTFAYNTISHVAIT